MTNTVHRKESDFTKVYRKRVKTTEEMDNVKSLMLNNKVHEALANELEITIITEVE